MRVLTVFLLTVVLASAGCTGKDDGDGATTPTPTPATGATPTSPTGATPTNPTNTTPTTPTAPAPKELCPVSKDYSGNVQPGAPPTTVSTGTCGAVTAGYTKLHITGNFTANSGSPVTLAEGISLKVVDAAGTAVLTCAGPSPGPAAPTPCDQEASAPVGDYTLLFEGSGAVSFAGSVMVR